MEGVADVLLTFESFRFDFLMNERTNEKIMGSNNVIMTSFSMFLTRT